MRFAALMVLLAPGAALAEESKLERALSRISEEAEVFAMMAPKALGKEVLVQKAAVPGSRFRPRVGAAATQPPPLRIREREIVSEYGFSHFQEAPEALHEFRQVVSVDGRQVAQLEKARATLTAGLLSDDDRLKKQMLRDFERHGLVGAASDFGQLILLFTKRRIGNFAFRPEGNVRIGADRAWVLIFSQFEGGESLTIFEGNRAVRKRLEGKIWLREPDLLPIRIMVESERQEKNATVRDTGTVDYEMSPHGALLPVSVIHRQHAGGQLMVENRFRYSDFRRFAAEAEIKFDVEPEAPPAPEKE
ncbi:MAG: hypothetical protein ACK5AZ_17405 [Bryobacteraceae bacterium]